MTELTSDIRISVRKGPDMYFGCATAHGIMHVVNDLVANGIDLFLHGNATRVCLAFNGDTITYSDDGPGLPYEVAGPNHASFAEHCLKCRHTTPTADDHVVLGPMDTGDCHDPCHHAPASIRLADGKPSGK